MTPRPFPLLGLLSVSPAAALALLLAGCANIEWQSPLVWREPPACAYCGHRCSCSRCAGVNHADLSPFQQSVEETHFSAVPAAETHDSSQPPALQFDPNARDRSNPPVAGEAAGGYHGGHADAPYLPPSPSPEGSHHYGEGTAGSLPHEIDAAYLPLPVSQFEHGSSREVQSFPPLAPPTSDSELVDLQEQVHTLAAELDESRTAWHLLEQELATVHADRERIDSELAAGQANLERLDATLAAHHAEELQELDKLSESLQQLIDRRQPPAASASSWPVATTESHPAPAATPPPQSDAAPAPETHDSNEAHQPDDAHESPAHP